MCKMTQQDFPFEKYFPIKGNNNIRLRLTIGLSENQYWVEVDLMSISGQKIIYHLGRKYNHASFFDAEQSGLMIYENTRIESLKQK